MTKRSLPLLFSLATAAMFQLISALSVGSAQASPLSGAASLAVVGEPETLHQVQYWRHHHHGQHHHYRPRWGYHHHHHGWGHNHGWGHDHHYYRPSYYGWGHHHGHHHHY